MFHTRVCISSVAVLNELHRIHGIRHAVPSRLAIGGSTALGSQRNNHILCARSPSAGSHRLQTSRAIAAIDNNAAASLSRRLISTHVITKHLQLLCDKDRCIRKDENTLSLKTPLGKPLVVMLPWLMAKPKHIRKYARLYIDQGYDVMTINVSPWQVIWPKNGSQMVAAEVVKFLANNIKRNPLILHGFSVGGYVWGECMMHMSKDIDRYRHVIDQFRGQIWDSVVELTEIPIGVPKAMFPKNDTLQRALGNYMMYHMKTFHDQATTHYIRSSQMFHSTLVKKPALFLLSHNDPIGSVSANEVLRMNWEALGIRCDWKTWDESQHVGHFQKYSDDYTNRLFEFLKSLTIEQHDAKRRATA